MTDDKPENSDWKSMLREAGVDPERSTEGLNRAYLYWSMLEKEGIVPEGANVVIKDVPQAVKYALREAFPHELIFSSNVFIDEWIAFLFDHGISPIGVLTRPDDLLNPVDCEPTGDESKPSAARKKRSPFEVWQAVRELRTVRPLDPRAKKLLEFACQRFENESAACAQLEKAIDALVKEDLTDTELEQITNDVLTEQEKELIANISDDYREVFPIDQIADFWEISSAEVEVEHCVLFLRYVYRDQAVRDLFRLRQIFLLQRRPREHEIRTLRRILNPAFTAVERAISELSQTQNLAQSIDCRPDPMSSLLLVRQILWHVVSALPLDDELDYLITQMLEAKRFTPKDISDVLQSVGYGEEQTNPNHIRQRTFKIKKKHGVSPRRAAEE